MSSMVSSSELAADVSQMPSQQSALELVAHEAVTILLCLAAFLVTSRFVGRARGKPKTVASITPCDRSGDEAQRGSGALGASKRSLKPEMPRGDAGPAPAATQGQRQAAPQLRAVEQQITRLLSQREFTKALSMYRACERDGRDRLFVSESFFSAFIQSSIRVGKADVAERFLRTMRQNGMQPSLAFWQTVLKMLSSRKHFSTVVAAYGIFDQQMPADKVTYSCLINAALDCDRAPLAARMLERYGEAGLQGKDYVLHFRTYAALADADAAVSLFRELMQATSATTLMLNLTLLACANSRKPQCAAELLAQAESQAVHLPDVVSYNTLIKGFAQLDDAKRCFDCFQEMRTRGREPDDVTLSSLVDVFMQQGSEDNSARLAEVLTAGSAEAGASASALVIRGLVRAGSQAKALEVYTRLQKHQESAGSETCFDVATYSILIKACIEQRDLERAFHLLESLRRAGHKPDDVLVTHLLDGCRQAANFQAGDRLYAEFLAAGAKPSEYTLMAMLKLCGRCGEHRKSYHLLEGFERGFGVKPSVIHFTCLMSACLRTRAYDLAWEAYELMRASGVEPDQQTLSTLIPGMVVAHCWERVLALLRRASQSKTALPAEIWSSALQQMSQAQGQKEQARELEALAQDAGVAVPAVRASPPHRSQ